MKLNRTIMASLEEWRKSSKRKPLLLRGARQTGKTWTMNEFGRTSFRDVLRIDFMRDPDAQQFFQGRLDPHEIVESLSIYTKKSINPATTLIIFDEIQECPQALTSLKYFCEDAPEYCVAATGSYMGISLHNSSPFPVGKVTMMTLYPLTFQEFLYNSGYAQLAERIAHGQFDKISDAFTNKLTELLKTYLYVGGMPEAVSHHLDGAAPQEVRIIQQDILNTYDLDFSKHAASRILERTRLVWSSLSGQLAKENRKFVYGTVRKGARAREFEECIQWLIDYGVVEKVQCLSTFRLPLAGYASDSAFKLFVLDVGLLSAMSELSESTLIAGSSIFTEFKGALTEQYVCQQLVAEGYRPYYWANPQGHAEVDFVVEQDSAFIPVEVKATVNLQAKSLRYVYDQYHPHTTVRTSLAGFRNDDWVQNIPLWAINGLRAYIHSIRTTK